YRIHFAENWQHGSSASNFGFARVLANTTAFTAASIFHEVFGGVSQAGTTCADSIADSGTDDSGGSSATVEASSISVSSTTARVQRSGALNLTPGHRYTEYVGANPGPGDCGLVSSFLVFSF